MPVCVGLNVTADGIIMLLGGKEYMDATVTLHILSISLVFSSLGTILSYAVLLPMNKEKAVFAATLSSAIINIFLNYFLIIKFQQNGAALATLISEIIVCTILAINSKKCISLYLNIKDFGIVALGCIGIIACSFLIGFIPVNIIIKCFIKVFACGCCYAMIVIGLRHSEINNVIDQLKKKFKLK
jgi:O-antigen/teichoic acid export membrane protein